MKKILSLLLLVTSMAFSQVTPLNVVQYPGNAINTNTFTIGNKANRSIGIITNNIRRLKIDSIGIVKINGTLQVVDGNQAAGRVLTSDANGLATWSTVAGGSGWGLTGNATGNNTSFIGTTDNRSFYGYSNNTMAFKVDSLQRISTYSTVTIGRSAGTSTMPLLVTDANCGGCQVDSESGIVLAKVSDDRAVNIHGFVNANAIAKSGTIASTSHNSFKDNSSFTGANTYGHHSSYENNFQYGGSATLGDAFGWYDKFNPSSGTTTNRIGFYCENAIGAGVLTNQYGIYIPSLTKGVNNYAIYVAASTPSHFKGNIQFSSGSGSAGAKTPTVGFYHGSANGQIISYFQSEWNGTNDKISFYNAKHSLAAWKEAFYIKGATTAANLNDTVVVNSTNYKSFALYNYLTGRFLKSQGTDVASATGSIAVGSGGNVFEITGTNAITLLESANWQNGSEVTFIFTSTASLTDGTANSGTLIGFELSGNANFTGSADDLITLVLCEMGGTQRWREKSRSVN